MSRMGGRGSGLPRALASAMYESRGARIALDSGFRRNDGGPGRDKLGDNPGTVAELAVLHGHALADEEVLSAGAAAVGHGLATLDDRDVV